MIEILILTAALGADSGLTGLMGPAQAAQPAEARTPGGACRLPVYMKTGKVRCAERPASTAFGKVTWVEEGRVVTLPVSQVDLERTMAAHSAAPRGGGFWVAQDRGIAGPGSPPPLVPQAQPGSGAETVQVPPEGKTILYEGTEDPPLEPLAPEERKAMLERLSRARIELNLMEDQLKAIALTGGRASNELSAGIIQRKKEIKAIQQMLSAR